MQVDEGPGGFRSVVKMVALSGEAGSSTQTWQTGKSVCSHALTTNEGVPTKGLEKRGGRGIGTLGVPHRFLTKVLRSPSN